MIAISYHDLVHTNAATTVDLAFGVNGLGILLITNLPSEMGFESTLRPRVLRLARSVAAMPQQDKDACSHPDSNYAVGYSAGQESMSKGHVDSSKSSFYSNPEYDVVTDDPLLKQRYPAIYADNLWPTSLPHLRDAVRDAGRHQIHIGLLVAKQIDSLVGSQFEALLSNVPTRKSRLLHYKPSDADQRLCGWHLDHGALTILMAPMYLNPDGSEHTDGESGLCIKTRAGATLPVRIPPNSVAVQLGELLQILSGGRLRATPHCVCSGIAQHGLSREQFVVFMDCLHDTPLSLPTDALPDALDTPFLPSGVPSLRSRFDDGMSYADFSKRTYQAYAAPRN